VNRAVFLDRDGVINELVYFPEAGVIDSPFTVNLFHVLPKVPEAIRLLNDSGLKVVVISNQPGVAKSKFTRDVLSDMDNKMTQELSAHGAHLDGIYYCLHHPEGTNGQYRCQCECRKPKPGMLIKAAKDLEIDLGQSFIVGDSLTDVEAGQNAGCRTILIGRLRCDLCRLMAKQNIQPDFVVDDLWAASQTILNSAPQTNKSLEEARWQRNIQKIFLDSARTKEAMIDVCTPSILQAASIIAKSHLNGGKLMLCGNGGSAADSQHIAGEFIGGLNSDRDREPLSAIALNTNTSNLTAIGNDFGFDQIFARQIKALGKTGDVLIGISTSGKSQNIIQAVIIAKELGIKTIGLMGQTGILKEIVEVAITVPSNNIQRIQEGHITIGHIICEIVEDLVNQKKLT